MKLSKIEEFVQGTTTYMIAIKEANDNLADLCRTSEIKEGDLDILAKLDPNFGEALNIIRTEFSESGSVLKFIRAVFGIPSTPKMEMKEEFKFKQKPEPTKKKKYTSSEFVTKEKKTQTNSEDDNLRKLYKEWLSKKSIDELYKVNRPGLYTQVCKEITGIKHRQSVFIEEFFSIKPEGEEWKPHPNNKSIYVSNFGRVRYTDSDGVIRDCLSKYGGKKGKPVVIVDYDGKAHSVAPLVVETWIGVPDGLKSQNYNVNFKDGNRFNLFVENLEVSKRTYDYLNNQKKSKNEEPEISRDQQTDEILETIKKGKALTSTAPEILSSADEKESEQLSFHDMAVMDSALNGELSAEDMTEKNMEMLIKSQNGDISQIFMETKDFGFAVNLFAKKRSMKMELSNKDLVIPILEFIKDSKGQLNSVNNIQKNIFQKYNKLSVSRTLIVSVMQKKSYENISNLVF